jgi:hypothetical protein
MLDGVKRGYENLIVRNAVHGTCQTATLPNVRLLERLPPQLHPDCCKIYHEELTRRAGSAKVFTNTNPGCIYDAARMVSIFKEVRFIFMKRNIEDNLLRIFMRKYTRDNVYGYDLKAAREHILWYHQMIDLMAEKFPDIVRMIHYEDMNANPAAALRAVAELCGLPAPRKPPTIVGGDPGCAAPYRQFMTAALES